VVETRVQFPEGPRAAASGWYGHNSAAAELGLLALLANAAAKWPLWCNFRGRMLARKRRGPRLKPPEIRKQIEALEAQ